MWIVLFMIMIMPFETNPYLKISDSFLGVIPDFTVIKLLGLVGLAWSGSRLMSGQRLGILDSGQGRAFCAYIALVVFATLASGAGLRQATRMFAIICLLPVVLAAVRAERDLNRALEALAMILIIVFPYAYRQMLRFGGRMGVGIYEPNYFALGLVLVSPLAFVAARQQKQRWKRLLWFGGFLIILLELMLTGSRGGLLGLIAVLALLALRLVRLRLPAIIGLGVLAGTVFLAVPSTLRDRVMASGFDPDMEEHSVSGSARTRIMQTRAGLRMMRAQPLTGVGLGNFKRKAQSYGAEKNKIAHNTYVEIGAELGLPGLAAFLYVMYSALLSLHRAQALAAAAGNLALRERALALQIGLIGYLVSATFLSAEYEKFLWIGVFLSICAERIARVGARAEERLPYGEPAWISA